MKWYLLRVFKTLMLVGMGCMLVSGLFMACEIESDDTNPGAPVEEEQEEEEDHHHDDDDR